MFTPSDLWVLPPPRLSAWFARIDWYLNWQLSKGLSYAGIHLPLETLHLAEAYEGDLPAVKPTDPAAPLLVLSEGRLPAARCVVVDGAADLKTWLDRIHQTALDMNISSLHIFLPARTTVTEAEAAWGKGKFKVGFSTDQDAKGITA